MTPDSRAQVPERIGFFGSIDGRWMWLGGDRISTTDGSIAPTTSGPAGQVMLGYKLDQTWDVALAGDVQGLMTELTKFRNGTLSVDTNHQHFDLELGFSNDTWRLNAGLRGIHFKEGATYNVPGFAGYDQREIFGIGPKVGIGARWALSEQFAIVGGANAALLYGSFADSGSGVLLNSGSYNVLMPQLDGELGLSWRPSETPSFSFTAGARAAASFNTTIAAYDGHRGTLFEYGPFVRIAYNFSGPRRPMRPVAQAESSEASDSKPASYTTHFAFERAEISPIAEGAIRQAAAEAAQGHRSVIRVAGPATLSAGAPEGDALSLRRADAIKDELLRRGLAREKISVVCEKSGLPSETLVAILY
jgi:outer membrane protein OmpA-like peptidoglycan-associated protein